MSIYYLKIFSVLFSLICEGALKMTCFRQNSLEFLVLLAGSTITIIGESFCKSDVLY